MNIYLTCYTNYTHLPNAFNCSIIDKIILICNDGVFNLFQHLIKIYSTYAYKQNTIGNVLTIIN